MSSALPLIGVALQVCTVPALRLLQAMPLWKLILLQFLNIIILLLVAAVSDGAAPGCC